MRNNKILFLLALVPATILTGCTNDYSQAVTSLDDFLVVSTVDQLQIQASLVKIEKGSSSAADDNASTSITASSADSGSIEAESKPAHGAYLFSGDNFQIVDGDSAYIGFSQTTNSETDYFLIDSNKKTGFVTLDQSLLSARLAQSKSLISTDYGALAAVLTLT
jgi:hypothetical protein